MKEFKLRKSEDGNLQNNKFVCFLLILLEVHNEFPTANIKDFFMEQSLIVVVVSINPKKKFEKGKR